MGFFARLLGQKITLAELTKLSEERVPSLVRQLDAAMHVSKLFPGENIPENLVESFKSRFTDIENKESRKAQSRLAKRHLLVGFDGIELYNTVASAALHDELVVPLAMTVAEVNPFFTNLASSEGLSVDIFKAHLSRFKLLEIVKIEGLRMIYEIEFPDITNREESERQYKLIVREHCRKLLTEQILLAARDSLNDLYDLANEYDFTEIRRRRALLDDFLNGVENENETQIDRVCEEFPKLLVPNYQLLKKYNFEGH